jgi:hypothetical protein
MDDRSAKRALTAMILLGVLLGGVWGVSRYGITNVRAWNLTGVIVIFTVAGYAAVFALLASRKKRDGA